jgi:hypothetical protein
MYSTFLSTFTTFVFTSLGFGLLGDIVSRVRVSVSGVGRGRGIRGGSVSGSGISGIGRSRVSGVGRSGISGVGRSGIRGNCIGAGSIRIVVAIGARSGVTIGIVVSVVVRFC